MLVIKPVGRLPTHVLKRTNRRRDDDDDATCVSCMCPMPAVVVVAALADSRRVMRYGCLLVTSLYIGFISQETPVDMASPIRLRGRYPPFRRPPR
jgi:hypothetical protein